MTKVKAVRTRGQRIYRHFSLWLVWVALLCTFLFVVMYDHIVYTTPVGSTSIHWQRIDQDGQGNSIGPLGEGLHLIPPWDVFYTYEIRLQEHKEEYQVLSKDGLHFNISVRFRWRALKSNIIGLNQRIGTDYVNRLLIPEIGSVTREIVANYKATALYSEKRNDVQDEIYNDLTDDTLYNHIVARDVTPTSEDDFIALQDLLITHVSLPEKMQAAIEAKLMEAEKVEEFSYRVERERLESDRKRVEAEGIATFQEIVTPAISESYLRWRGIEATLSLAESNNTKIVVIGNSETGLPLIFDTRTDLGNEPTAQNSSIDAQQEAPERVGEAMGTDSSAQSDQAVSAPTVKAENAGGQGGD
ncbi:MAG: prohibitin family protein [Congregibacter sp.]